MLVTFLIFILTSPFLFTTSHPKFTRIMNKTSSYNSYKIKKIKKKISRYLDATSQLSYGRHVHVVVHLFPSSRNRFFFILFLMLNTHLSYTLYLSTLMKIKKKLRNVGKEVKKRKKRRR